MFSMIRNAVKEYRELKWLAYHDSLTHLYNRHWLHKNMESLEFEYIYFIDFVNLHGVNNKHGHLMGDDYINVVVKGILLEIDETDVLVRYAGDEFILFSDTSDVLLTNNKYYVGVAHRSHHYSVANTIRAADALLIKEKKNYSGKGPTLDT